jgi:hypothetical protein
MGNDGGTSSHMSSADYQLYEIDRYEPTIDDQLGVRILLKPELPDHIPTLPAYDRTLDISDCLLDSVGGFQTQNDLLTNQ